MTTKCYPATITTVNSMPLQLYPSMQVAKGHSCDNFIASADIYGGQSRTGSLPPQPSRTTSRASSLRCFRENVCHQRNGTSRKRVWRQYSVYPGKSWRRTFSSLTRRRTINGMSRMKAGKVTYDPSAKGVNSHIAHAPKYIGWRTMRY